MIKDTDKGYRELVERVYGMGAPKITVGVHASEAAEQEPGGTTIGDVATWNEFGTGDIPARSFIRAWFDQHEAEVRQWIKVQLLAVVKGQITKEQALQRVAERALGGIKQRMADGIDPPNAPSTIAKKGSSKPLIDTGRLRSAITVKVRP